MASSSAPRNPLAAVYDTHAAAGLAHLQANRTMRVRLAGLTPDHIDDLDMGSIRGDILALLGGNLDALGLDLDRAIALGFEAIEDDEIHHGILTGAWQRALRAAAKRAA